MSDQSQVDANVPPTVVGAVSVEVQEAALRPENRLGRYVILSAIGHGGMGAVYRAWDPSLARVVALKRLHSNMDEGLRERFLREGRAAARLRHPGIVAVHDVGEHEGMPYLTMDLVPGKTLTDRLDRGGMDGLRERVRLLQEMSEAVGFAHAQGIVHRDLKPENVLVTAEGRPVVTDFGLAKDLHQAAGATLTESGAILGTPYYMSPEQAAGRSVIGPTSDVFSLGVILYQALAGRRPFEGLAISSILRSVQEDDPAPPRRFARDIPQDLESVCFKALEKDPSRRYADGRAFAEDLARWLAGDPVLARPVSVVRRAGRWVRRNRSAALVTLAVVLLVVTGVSASLWRRASARARATLLVAQARETVQRVRNARGAGNRVLMDSLVKEAERLAEQARGLVPDAAEAYLERGRARALVGRLNDARADLDHAVSLSPDDTAASAERGRVLARLYRSGIARAQPAAIVERISARTDAEVEQEDPDLRGIRETAEGDLRTAAKALGSNAETDLLRAWLATLRGEWAEAIAASDAVLAAELSDEAHLLKGMAILRKAEAEEVPIERVIGASLEVLDKAVFLGAGYGDAWLGRAEARLRWCEARHPRDGVAVFEDLDRAIEDARRAEERGADPFVARSLIAQAHWVRGEVEKDRVHRSNGRPTEARDRYRMAIDLLESDPSKYADDTGLYLRAKLWDRYAIVLGRCNEDPLEAARTAVARMREFLARKPRSGVGYVRLGHYLMDLSNAQGLCDEPWEEALREGIEAYTRALELGEDDEWAWFYRGGAYYALADVDRDAGRDARPGYERACADLDVAVGRLPDQECPQAALSHLFIGILQAGAGESPVAHLDRAEELFRPYLTDDRRNQHVEIDYGTILFWKAHAEEGAGRACEGLYQGALEHFRKQTQVPEAPDHGWLGMAMAEAALLRVSPETVRAGAAERVLAPASRWCSSPSNETVILGYVAVLEPFLDTALGMEGVTQAGLLDLARVVGEAMKRPCIALKPGRLPDLAFAALERARAAGPLDRAALRADERLAPLRGDARWAAILAE